ncbi:heterokaryon incompatibility protein-domain-containing protein [Tricladium varicosporioides]|nr:heterokaryon incompatibility protein-domain-containing protein [Hymenoscyphus varicosporioides]
MDDKMPNSVVQVDNKVVRGSRSATPVHAEYFGSEIGSDDDSGWETDLLDDSELSRSLCRNHEEFRIASDARIKQGNLTQLATEDMHVEQNICRMCRKMLETFIYLPPAREVFVLHFYFYLLYQQTLAAAHQGCALCAMFVGQASMGRRSIITELPGVNGANWEDPPHERLSFSLQHWGTRPDGDRGGYWGFYFMSNSSSRGFGVKSPMMIIRHARLDDFRPSPIDCNGLPVSKLMSLARGWLAKCRKHPACLKRLAENTSFSPTRLISTCQNQIRLCSSKTRPTREYATLSHCWGGNSEILLKLTKDTIEEYHNEIPVQKLSRTFRQAINIAQDLGIDYIWIDSLCIIQDDDDDWKQEAALMHGVYGNSFLNIAASDACDGSKGCFIERNKSFQTFHTVRVKLGDDCNPRSYSIIPTSIFRALSKTVLASRGWCLQERLLAPRTLHFEYRQLYWECDTRQYCECFPRGIPARLRSHCFEVDRVNHDINKSRLIEDWHTILHIYTRSAFTRPSDRLIALSGVIRKIELQTADICYFGIWRKDFEYNLMWTVRKLTVLDNYRAPSWSWASVDGPYDKPQILHDAKCIAHFLHVDKEPVEYDAEQDPCCGQLKMSCQSMIELVYSDTTQPILTHSIPQYNYSKWRLRSAPKTIEGDARWSCDSYPNDTSVYFLPVWFYHSVHGLLLASTGKKGQYRRVASFIVRNEQPEILLEKYRPDESVYESCFDSEAYPDERWVITII